MKPNFALSLSFDGIRLLHRAAGGWHLLGEVSVSDPALTEALAALRDAGAATNSGPLYTKLIIPDEQIRYLSIQTPGQDDAARKEAARSALEGATPYPVDALAFDISPDQDTTHLAAVARETLQEAEEFAQQHGFAPVSFVAAGIGADFLGEPFFGPSEHAKTVLPPGTDVEPDGVRVVIVEKPAEPEPTVVEDSADPLIAQAEESDQSKDEAKAASFSDTDDDTTNSKAAAPERADETAANVSEDAAPTTSPAPTDPVVLDTQADDAGVNVDEIDIPDNLPIETEQTTPPLLGFATRRRQDPSSDAPPLRLGGVSRDTKVPAKSPPLSTPAAGDASDQDEANLTAPPRSATDSLRPTEPPLVAASQDATAPLVAPVKTRPSGFLSRRKTPVAAKAADRKPAARAAAPARTTAQVADPVETERMTVFGARGDGTVGGKPRFLGLILTAVLLVFLAGVAAWASIFLDDGLARLLPQRERTLASTLPDDTSAALAEDVGATTDLERDPEAEADGVVVAALNDSLSDDGLSAEDAAVLDALRDPLPAPVAPEELDAAALEARYA